MESDEQGNRFCLEQFVAWFRATVLRFLFGPVNKRVARRFAHIFSVINPARHLQVDFSAESALALDVALSRLPFRA